MKKYIVVFTLLCMTNVFAQENDWVITKDTKRGYKIEFPEQPKEESQPVNTDIGEVTMDFLMVDHSSKSDPDNLIYMVAYTEYPKDTDYSDEGLQQSMLDGSVNGAVSNVNGTLRSSENIIFNGFNGRDAKISIQSDQYLIHLKNILVDNKLYMIQAIYKASKENNASELKFFNSFELINMN